MIIMNIRGGFGNQLFEYAMGYARAKDNKTTLLMDLSQHAKGYFRACELEKLNLEFKQSFAVTSKNKYYSIIKRSLAIGRPYRFIREANGKYTTYDQSVIKKSKISTYYYGLWQSYKYFAAYRDELIHQFQPIFELSKEAKTCQNRIREDKNSVALHIRRGDYVQYNGCISLDYYRSAMEMIRGGVNDESVFYIFSDDVDWVKENLADARNIVYLTEGMKISDIEEFYIMSAAHTHIIANSTFSWWAAYLNNESNHQVYAPGVGNWSGDFYPENWNIIPTTIENAI